MILFIRLAYLVLWTLMVIGALAERRELVCVSVLALVVLLAVLFLSIESGRGRP